MIEISGSNTIGLPIPENRVDAIASRTSIPEPGSVAGILTVGLLGIFSRSRKST